jgi:HEAT repeat protein
MPQKPSSTVCFSPHKVFYMSTPPTPEPSSDLFSFEQALFLLTNREALQTERLEALLALVREESAGMACIGTLLERLHDETEEMDFRCSVALALGHLMGQLSTYTLQPEHLLTPLQALSQLVKQPETPVRLKTYALQALGSSGFVEVAPVLIAALQESDNNLFGSAADALGQLSQRVRRPIIPLLCEVLETAADDARCVAAWQLGELRDATALEPLLQQARYHSNKDVQALCLWALGQLGQHNPQVLAVMQWAKQEATPEIRLRAETALKKIVSRFN